MPCQRQKSALSVVNLLQPNTSITYTENPALCFEYHSAISMLKRCGCIGLEAPIPFHLRNVARRCVNASHFTPTQIFANILCHRNYFSNFSEAQRVVAVCNGVQSCRQRQYDIFASSATWPTSGLAQNFVQSVLKPTFDKRAAQNLSMPAWLNAIDANPTTGQMLSMVRDFDNFVGVFVLNAL